VLLQHALFPLTRSLQQGEGALHDDDLRPHASPKAKQVYETLVRTGELTSLSRHVMLVSVTGYTHPASSWATYMASLW
jgi:hypothetical protein